MLCLITGAEQGLGLTISRLMEARGYHIHNIPGAQMMGGFRQIDHHVSQLDRCPDIIVNNFGINHLSWIGETREVDEDVIMSNVLGPYWVINQVRYRWKGPCRVINIASQTYRVPQRCTTLYSASKAALVQMTKVMARELAPSGWVINAVSPGKIEDTEMSRKTDAQVLKLRGWTKEDADAYALKNVPAGRFTNRDEMGRLVMKVLDMPEYVNGAVIEAHGGA